MAENTNPDSGSEVQLPQGTMQEAASSFYNLLGGDEAPEDGQAEDQPEGEEELQGEEKSQEQVEEDSQDSDNEPDEQLYAVKVNGEEKELTLSELKSLAQQGADYTKKTQQVAEQRKEVEAQAVAIEQAKQLRDAYAERLQVMEQLLSAPDQNVDLESLKENDPIGYAVAVAEQQQNREKMQAIQAERYRIAEQQQAEQQQYMKQYLAGEAEKLTTVLPEYSDPVKGETLRSDMRKFAKDLGFSDQDLSMVRDHRQVMTLYKAMMYDKLQQSKPSVNKRVNEAPKNVRTGNNQEKVGSDTYKQQSNQLRQSGKIKDAAALFENFL